MQYIISDSSVVAVSQSSGTLQNVSNDKIEVSNSANFTDCLIVYPFESISFNAPVFVRAVNTVNSTIAFNVVAFAVGAEVSSSEVQNYARAVNVLADGVAITDGNGNLIYKIPIMKE